MINKPILASFLLVFGLSMAGIVWQLQVQFERTVAYFDMDGEKRLIDAALSYMKRAYGESKTEAERAAVQADFDFANGRQAYIWLFDAFGGRLRTRTLLSTAAFAAALLLAGCALFYAAVRQYGRPLESVLACLARYARDGAIGEASVRGTRRMRESVGQFNAVMAELRRRTVAEKVSGSFENWQGGARIILHEVKNKLSPLSLLLDHLGPGSRDAALDPVIGEIRGRAEDLHNLVLRFRDFSSLPEPHLAAVRVGDLVRNMIASEGWAGRVSLDGAFEDFTAYSDPFYLGMILSNVVRNAVEACGGQGPCVAIGCSGCAVTVRDRGAGIPEEIAGKVGRPGFTTKPEGHGMGLFTVKELCRILGLSFRMESAEGSGTEVRVEFPDGRA